jgi:hypothetical protein
MDLVELALRGDRTQAEVVVAVSREAPAARQVLVPFTHFCGMQVGANQPSSPVWPVLTVIVLLLLAAK